MHRLLQRQLAQARDQDGAVCLERLTALVSDAYEQQERNRLRADRANELMAAELTEMIAIRERSIQSENAQRLAEAASLAKSQFLAAMSHELRTPLNAVIGYAEIIEDEYGASHSALKEDARRIAVAGRHLLEIVNGILDLAKIESGKMTVDPQEFDLHALVAEVSSLVRPLAQKNGNRLVVSLAEALPVCFSDHVKLRQCILNLAGNAAKFTRGGTIAIAVATDAASGGRSVRVEVADTGIGISPEALPRLFKPFCQADESTTRKYGGTGLGLALTKAMVELMGGSLGVESEVGKGSVFHLSFPARLERRGRALTA